MVIGVVSVSCGIDRVLPVLRPVCVCDEFVSSRLHVCVWEACRMYAPSDRSSILHQPKWYLTNLFLEQFGGVDSNSLCYLLNNNIPRNNNVNIIDVEPDVIQHSSYHDDASLSNLFEARADVFSILSLNCQSINAEIDQINIKLQQLKSSGHEFSAICLQETWLSEDSDIPLLKKDGYSFIPQGKICSAHGGLAIYLSSTYKLNL